MIACPTRIPSVYFLYTYSFDISITTRDQHSGSFLQYVKGIGPKRSKALESIGIHSVHDLFYYFPRDYLDRSRIILIKDLKQHVGKGTPVTVIGEVFRFELRRSRKSNKQFF
ncbi:MAG TPA: hypothetical protein VNL36_10540, partial [Bacteroidota bacterium]|nr:hypothetical protein [Bacteroidota bacterium]